MHIYLFKKKEEKKNEEKKNEVNDWGIKIVEESNESTEVKEVKDMSESNMSLEDLKKQFAMFNKKE